MRKKIFYVLLVSVVIIFVAWQIRLKQSFEKEKTYAYTLVNKGLYKPAVAVYKHLMDSGRLSNKEKANISYLIGNIYMDDLHDYENALANYLKVEILTPKTKLKDEINRRSIECLERLGKSLAAQQKMDKLTKLIRPSEKQKTGETVVAVVGRKEITLNELNRRINELPPYLQEAYKDKSKKLEFLKNYIATELMYDTAKRKGYAQNKNIIDRAFQIKKSLMVEKLINEEIKDKIKVSDREIELYYQANKEEFVEKKDGKERQKSFDEVRNYIKSILVQEQEKKAYNQLIGRMMQAEKVKIYYDIFATQ